MQRDDNQLRQEPDRERTAPRGASRLAPNRLLAWPLRKLQRAARKARGLVRAWRSELANLLRNEVKSSPPERPM
jgi:hypothetical protein